MEKLINLPIKRAIALLVLLAVVSTTHVDSYAQEVKKVGTSAAAFLRIPIGARGTSMGSAFVSVADDPSAMFWNPGGLARLEENGLLVDHSSWLPGLKFNYFALALSSGTMGSMGVNVTVLGTDKMDITTIDRPMGTGERFDAMSLAIGLTYSRYLTDRFSLGATVKYVDERILNSHASGFALDIGTIYDTPFSGIRVGFSVSNFGTKMQMQGEDLNIRVDVAPDQEGNNQSVVGQLKTDEFDMPLIMRLGLSWDALQMENYGLTIAVDGLNPNDNANSVNVGGEFTLLNETLALRAGYNDLFLPDRIKGLTLGAGINTTIYGRFAFSADYAYQDFKYLGGVNRFTLLLKF